MFSTDSYEEDYYSYEFSEPEFNPEYDVRYEPPVFEDSNPPPTLDELLSDPVIPDPAIAICNSLDQSKKLIQEHFGVPSAALRSHPFPGLVILPLKDINLIRKDNRSQRKQSMILIIPSGENFEIAHSDLAQMIHILHQ